MFNFKDIKGTDAILPAKKGDPSYPAKKGLKFLGLRRVNNEGKADDKSIEFSFVDPITGSTLNHREFVPKRINDTQTDEQFKTSITMSVSRIAHIVRAFVSQEEFETIGVTDPNNLNKAAENWMEITKQVGKLLKKKIDEDKIDTTCDLKIVLRKVVSQGKTNYYSSLPQVPSFISTANHPKEFKVDPRYDIMEQPTVSSDTEKPATQGNGLTTSPLTEGTPAPGAAPVSSGSDDF